MTREGRREREEEKTFPIQSPPPPIFSAVRKTRPTDSSDFDAVYGRAPRKRTGIGYRECRFC